MDADGNQLHYRGFGNANEELYLGFLITSCSDFGVEALTNTFNVDGTLTLVGSASIPGPTIADVSLGLL